MEKSEVSLSDGPFAGGKVVLSFCDTSATENGYEVW
jgi:hypothetical protein